MLARVNRKDCDLSKDRTQLVTEASDVGLEPGEWPFFIALVDDSGNGSLFRRGTPLMTNGELGGYGYYTQQGGHLVVFND